jgi:hypothetical protein
MRIKLALNNAEVKFAGRIVANQNNEILFDVFKEIADAVVDIMEPFASIAVLFCGTIVEISRFTSSKRTV